jgi:predicted transcriptional regulator
MSHKETVLEAVRNLPDDCSLERIVEEISILAAIQRGLDAVEQGRTVSHEEARQRFEKWLSESNGPNPPSTTSKTSPVT